MLVLANWYNLIGSITVSFAGKTPTPHKSLRIPMFLLWTLSCFFVGKHSWVNSARLGMIKWVFHKTHSCKFQALAFIEYGYLHLFFLKPSTISQNNTFGAKSTHNVSNGSNKSQGHCPICALYKQWRNDPYPQVEDLKPENRRTGILNGAYNVKS